MSLLEKLMKPRLIACTACLQPNQKGNCLPLDIATKVIIQSGTAGLVYHVATDHDSINDLSDYGWSFFDLLKNLPELENYVMLSNTSRAKSAQEAIYRAYVGVKTFQVIPHSQEQTQPIIKLEVLTDSLQCNNSEVLKAVKELKNDGFEVIPLISPDLGAIQDCVEFGVSLARVLVGRIGSLTGVKEKSRLASLTANAPIPLIFEGGHGNINHVKESFQLGASAVLLNSAILKSPSPPEFVLKVRETIDNLGMPPFRIGGKKSEFQNSFDRRAFS